MNSNFELHAVLSSVLKQWHYTKHALPLWPSVLMLCTLLTHRTLSPPEQVSWLHHSAHVHLIHTVLKNVSSGQD